VRSRCLFPLSLTPPLLSAHGRVREITVNPFLRLICGLAALLSLSFQALATVSVVDDTGQNVTLTAPATRIISLAPNITEILFHIGAGAQVVGVVSYSDFPPEAIKVAGVGTYDQLDIEAILKLQPDLVVGWNSGNSAEDLKTLEELGLTVYRNESKTLEDVASSMQQFAALTGHSTMGNTKSAAFLEGTLSLQKRYQDRKNLRVFYQIWGDPIYTVNGHHLISHLINQCGGTNIFSGLETLAPVVTTESVIERNPEVIVAGVYPGPVPEWFGEWNKWSGIEAVKSDHLYTIDTNHISRMGPRILLGMQAMCEVIDKGREGRH